MEYKVGDTVRIKNNLDKCKFLTGIVPQMLQYEGQKTKIKTIWNDHSFRLEIDNGSWLWHMDLLEPISENKIFHLGNFININ
jgi:hypothetical protein